MAMLVTVFWVMHLAATVAILGGWVAGRFTAAWGITLMTWAVRSQLVIGMILVDLTFSTTLNYAKVIVKLVLALIAVAFAEIANAKAKRGEKASGQEHVAAGLTVLIAVISFLW
jgi:hypothetical protein